MIKLACIAAAAAVLHLGTALAEGRAVARLVGVSGNILVSNDQTIASVGEAFRLVPGMRVLATLNSQATVVYESGCRVHVRPGERLDVRADVPCERKSPQPVALAPVLGSRP